MTLRRRTMAKVIGAGLIILAGAVWSGTIIMVGILAHLMLCRLVHNLLTLMVGRVVTLRSLGLSLSMLYREVVASGNGLTISGRACSLNLLRGSLAEWPMKPQVRLAQGCSG